MALYPYMQNLNFLLKKKHPLMILRGGWLNTTGVALFRPLQKKMLCVIGNDKAV
jgi:hypothetical protein